jgi:hypothetical protein
MSLPKTDRPFYVPDAIIAQAVQDAQRLQDAGAWDQAKACCWATYHANRRTGLDPGLAIEFLANDVADMLGLNRARVLAVAINSLIGNRASVMADELRAQAADLDRRAPLPQSRFTQRRATR